MMTVFTPTYNRAYKLTDLYQSLLQQTCLEFEWLIIYDGSLDNTRELVASFKDNGKFPIRYIYKQNEGKQIAINHAAKEAKGEWIFIVDSDDVLTTNAVEKVRYYCDSIADDENFAGVAGLRGKCEGGIWLTDHPDRKDDEQSILLDKEYIDATAIDYRFKYKIKGDRAEVLRREILLKYPFPHVEGERFIPESYLWYSLADDGYLFRWFNEVIYITEYLEDGLTRNGREMARKNCLYRSCLENLLQNMVKLPLKERVKSAINYCRYGRYGKNSFVELYYNSKCKWLTLFAIPIAVMTRIK